MPERNCARGSSIPWSSVYLARSIPALVYFFDELEPVIEVIRGAERPLFWILRAEGIVPEGCCSAIRAGHNGLGQAVLEVPGIGFAGGIGEGIAVCVVL